MEQFENLVIFVKAHCITFQALKGFLTEIKDEPSLIFESPFILIPPTGYTRDYTLVII